MDRITKIRYLVKHHRDSKGIHHNVVQKEVLGALANPRHMGRIPDCQHVEMKGHVRTTHTTAATAPRMIADWIHVVA